MATAGEGGPSGRHDEDQWRERRAHKRVSLEAEVWIGQDGVFSRNTERLADLSLGGAFIELAGSYQQGSIFDLRMEIDRTFINATVIVRRVSPTRGVGVQFLDLSPEAQRFLGEFLEARGT